MDEEYAEYRCSACKKEIKSQIVTCKSCVKLFFHPGCTSKHKSYDRNREYVSCPGPFEKFVIENEKKIDLKTRSSRDRLGSTGSIGSIGKIENKAAGTGGSMGMDVKIDWLVRTVREMKDEVACKREIKMMIKEVVQEEVKTIKQDLEDLRKAIQGAMNGSAEGAHSSYSEAAKKKKENIIIIKPKIQQESETTKKVIKEKVDIKKMSMGITKLRKGREGTVILGCETGEEMVKLKDTVQTKLGENYSVTESLQMKPKLKIINISEEEMELDDDELIHTVEKQNDMDGSHMRIVKRILKKKNKDNSQSGNKGKEGESVIIEVDEGTHNLMLKKEKLNIGWRKCPVFNYYSVKRCFKCWGYYHIAKNCTRDETCHKCTGKHKATECTATKNKCVNCMFKIKAYNLKISDEHDALSPECPTYKRAIEEEKRRAGWDVNKK